MISFIKKLFEYEELEATQGFKEVSNDTIMQSNMTYYYAQDAEITFSFDKTMLYAGAQFTVISAKPNITIDFGANTLGTYPAGVKVRSTAYNSSIMLMCVKYDNINKVAGFVITSMVNHYAIKHL